MGLALKKANADLEIIGHDKDGRHAQQALKRGAVDKTEWNLLNACDGAGLVVLAIPLAEIEKTLNVLRKALAPGVIVTDTAATKTPVIEWARALSKGVYFVGGDPIIPPTRLQNTTLRGIDAADADLFQNAVYCLTPTTAESSEVIDVLASFVAMLGAKPLFMDAAEHDGLVAGAQHLAYVLSAALLQATTQSSGWREMSRFAGSDYLQATELASRDPVSQREIVLTHREDLTRWIDKTFEALKELRGVISRGDAEALDAMFKQMVAAREEWIAGESKGVPTSEFDELQASPMRLFLGGLATRGGKKI